MSTTLAEISSGLRQLVDAFGPAVVRVEGRRRFPSTGFLWSGQGLIVTAQHTLDREEGIDIGLPGGPTVPASLVGRDPGTDLAVLRVEGEAPPAPTLEPEDSPHVGDLLLVLARPGRTVQASLGIVGAVAAEWRTWGGAGIRDLALTDVPRFPGLSGGPVLTASGHLLGLYTTGLARHRGAVVPAVVAGEIVEKLLAHGRVPRAYLGITVQPVRVPREMSKEHERGLLILSVEPGSPAEQGGLLMGDTLLTLGGAAVADVEGLWAALAEQAIGAEVTLGLLRGGQPAERTVTVAERP